jgi:hypothetical protein
MQHILQGTYDFLNSGKITVRAIYDVDNRASHPLKEKDCNKNGPDGGPSAWKLSEGVCITKAAQVVEWCMSSVSLPDLPDHFVTSADV